MVEFLKQNYSLIIFLVELIAAVTGLFLYKKYKGTAAIYFIYFLVYAIIIENLGKYNSLMNSYNSLNWLKELVYGTLFEKNYWWFQLFWIIGSPMFFAHYFYLVSKLERNKKVIKIVTIAFFVLSIISLLCFSEKLFTGYITLNFILSLLMTLFLVFTYYFELLKSDEVLNFYKSISFYISVGNLFFWLLITPLTFYEIYFSIADWNFIILKWQIFLFSIVFMYLTFTIGLIVSKPEYLQK